jgi:hypothetical protein
MPKQAVLTSQYINTGRYQQQNQILAPVDGAPTKMHPQQHEKSCFVVLISLTQASSRIV